MIILAVETSTEYLSVAIADGDKITVRDCLAGQRHSELILPMIQDVLSADGIEDKAIRAIAFGAGPGSFTGLRIACGVAQGLAFGLDVPLIPISTLEAVAEATDRDRVVAALDARMGEIYHAAFEREGRGWKTVAEASLCKPENSPALAGKDWFAAGSGFAAHKQVLVARYGDQLSGVDESVVPHARAMARLAIERFRHGLVVAAEDAAPVYIRNKVALTLDEQAARK